MMDQSDPQDQAPAEPAPDAPPAAAGPAPGPAHAETVASRPPARGAGRRFLVALVLLPWIIGYGSVGVWAVLFGARAAASGHALVDAGYTRMVTPGGVIVVGGLLLAAFAATFAVALLLVYGSRRRGAWAAVAAATATLTAGAVWAGIRGGLHPLLWAIFFFGLACALVVALAAAWRSGRVPRP